MPAIERIEAIKRLAKGVQAGESIQLPPYAGVNADEQGFANLMQKPEKALRIQESNLESKESRKPSPMEEAAKLHRQGASRPDKVNENEILAYAEKSIAQIDDVKKALGQPDLKLRASVQNLLRTKLSDINDNLRVAFRKAGIDYVGPEPAQGPMGPIQKFLGLLTHAQTSMQSLGSHVNKIKETPGALTPANMIGLQIKVHHVQQQVEFFSNLLNKMLEGTKTIMNVQV